MSSENEYIKVDAKRAIRWLEVLDDKLQRPLSDTIVRAYTDDMLAGEYYDNGATIVFYGPLIKGEPVPGETKLGDGQHRLWAVIEAAGTQPDIEIEFLVVWNVDTKAAPSIDAGRPRSYRHHQKILQRENASKIPTIVRRVHNWDRGYRLPVGNARVVLTNTGIDRVYREEAEAYDESVRQGSRLAAKFGVSRAGSSIAFHLLARIDTERAEKFYDDIIAWQKLGIPGHQVLALVESFGRRKPGRKNQSLSMDETMILIILCWNSIVQGQKSRSRFNIEERYFTNTDFPIPLTPGSRPTKKKVAASAQSLLG